MQRKIIGVALLFCLFSCVKEDKVPPIEEMPELQCLSTIPVDGTNDVSSLETVELKFTYNYNILIATPHNITLNEKVINSVVKTSGKDLKIPVILEPETDYQLVIPAGTVKASEMMLSAKEIKINFKTKNEPLPEVPPLVTQNPSPEAVNLYNYLRENYGKKIISGAVARVDWNITEAERVSRWTDKFPKINVFDYIFLYASPAPGWIDYGNISVVENWYNTGGIVGAMWHWNVPKSETSATNDVSFRPKDSSFPDGTTFRPANALIEGTWENKVMKADLKKVADYLLLLKNKNIPVLWRPLHEAAGNTYATGYKGTAWFWWGRDGAEAFKGLWQYMFNYFQERGLNNLIWIWTTEVNDPPFYPGDEYVDIVGRDEYGTYNNNQLVTVLTATKSVQEFNQIQNLYPKKMIALAECGGVANISEQWMAGARWLWFMPWYDGVKQATDYTNLHQYAGKDWWQNAANQSFVVFR